MRALCVDQAEPGGVALVEDYPDPRPGRGEVLVRVDLAGVCATDLEIVLKSTYARTPDVDLSPIVINALVLAGNRCGPFDEALRLLREKRVQVDQMISGVFPLTRATEAIAAAVDPQNLKILLQPGAP